MSNHVYNPSEILFGYKKLMEDGKSIKDLVKCDIQGMLAGKDYNGVKYMPNIEAYLGVVNNDKIEYGYKPINNIKLVKVPIAYGPLAHDHKSRGTSNTGASVSIRRDAVGANGQKVGEALKLLSDAYLAHLDEYTTDQFNKTKKADKVTVPYKTTDKDGKPIKEPMITIKFKFKLPKDQKSPGLRDVFDITVLDVTKKIDGKLAPLTVKGEKLCYGNMHEVITMNSEITGTIKITVNRSNLGISAGFSFTSLMIKSAGNGSINVEEALGDIYGQFLEDAVDDKQKFDTSGSSTSVSSTSGSSGASTSVTNSVSNIPSPADDVDDAVDDF